MTIISVTSSTAIYGKAQYSPGPVCCSLRTAFSHLPRVTWSVIMCEPMALVVDDDADLYVAWNDSPALDSTQNPYPTHKLGSHVHEELFGQLHLRLPEHGGPQVKHVPGNGNCENESPRRGYV